MGALAAVHIRSTGQLVRDRRFHPDTADAILCYGMKGAGGGAAAATAFGRVKTLWGNATDPGARAQLGRTLACSEEGLLLEG